MSENPSPSSSKDEVGEGSSRTATSSKQQSSPAESEGAAADEEKDSSVMEKLQQFMTRAFHLDDKEKEEVPQVLEEVTFEGVCRYMRSGKCKNIITMVGAGISTSAGIPDFRSPGTGLYDNLHQYNLPHPQAIFMIDFFKGNPKPFFVLAKELYPGSFKPTICHYFIKLLNEKGLLLRHYTQNIDTLERVSALPLDKLVEAHGTFQTSHCLECGAEYSLPWMKEKIFADEIPTCTEEDCVGVIKPDIVFFGESLPDRFSECVAKDMKQCDLLIIMGTSLVVQPFASLANRVSRSIPRLYINLEKTTPEDDMMAMLMGGGGGFRFDAEDNVRDVYQQATCDTGCSAMADLLGWGDELRELVEKEHARIDKEMEAKKDAASSHKNKRRSPSPAGKPRKNSTSPTRDGSKSPSSKSPEQKL
ncbi:NAD-dependent protein deacetylase sirtuin-2-like [Littorina saxatilis]|uniref:NAD-dependent protein deacetylase n=1 Tax=Littorina saxatilis TaxID=31220 RepID=A0AAN9BCS9_9CAEN